MTDQQILSRAYQAFYQGFVQNSRALHYTELGQILGVTPAEAREIQQELANSGLPFILQADTDYVAAVSPFSSIPTQYRVSIDGRPGWYAI